MLFLVVFLGFIAENVRENIAESSRAKEYAKGFISDLRLAAAKKTFAKVEGETN